MVADFSRVCKAVPWGLPGVSSGHRRTPKKTITGVFYI